MLFCYAISVINKDGTVDADMIPMYTQNKDFIGAAAEHWLSINQMGNLVIGDELRAAVFSKIKEFKPKKFTPPSNDPEEALDFGGFTYIHRGEQPTVFVFRYNSRFKPIFGEGSQFRMVNPGTKLGIVSGLPFIMDEIAHMMDECITIYAIELHTRLVTKKIGNDFPLFPNNEDIMADGMENFQSKTPEGHMFLNFFNHDVEYKEEYLSSLNKLAANKKDEP